MRTDEISPAQKKHILSDPVRYFSALNPDSIRALNEIKKLWKQRQLLEKKQKQIQTQTGILSRKIGEAKRNKESPEALVASMQAVSVDLKYLSKTIKRINHDILNHFSDNPTSTNNIIDEQCHQTCRRDYSATKAKSDNIFISIFDASSNQEEWNDYVSKNSAACIHHRAEWLNTLSQSYGLQSLYFCARDANRNIIGILPLIHMKNRLFGNKLVSMPFFQRGGAVADEPLIEQKLILSAINFGSKLNVDYIEFRDDIPREDIPAPFAIKTHKVNMVLSLPETKDALWRGFTSKLRAQIRRSQRVETQILIGGQEYLNDFYAVYSRNMRDLGSPVQSKHFIGNIMLHFPNNSWLIVIKLHQRPVAAGFLLGSKDTLEIPLASTIREVNHLSINMLLYWEILKFAVKHNYSEFDFGRSSKNAGTYRFKQQWGAKPKQLYWHYWLGCSESLPSMNPSSPKYSLIINTWKRLPVALANFLGPYIVKNLP